MLRECSFQIRSKNVLGGSDNGPDRLRSFGEKCTSLPTESDHCRRQLLFSHIGLQEVQRHLQRSWRLFVFRYGTYFRTCRCRYAIFLYVCQYFKYEYKGTEEKYNVRSPTTIRSHVRMSQAVIAKREHSHSTTSAIALIHYKTLTGFYGVT